MSKLSAAFLYSIAVAVALNFFWEPGGIYASGITGLAQLISTITKRFAPFTVSTALMLLVLNLPLFVLAWRKIGHHFTVFTIISVVLSSLMMKIIPVTKLTIDPIICAIFGAVLNGAGTGFALKNGISTGGLDILGIVLRKKTGKSIGTINIIFNAMIIFAAGFIFGWPHAFYSALSIFINGKVMDLVYTRHQKLQVMIVTSHPKNVIEAIQSEMRRGITIVHDAEGAYKHQEKTILFTVISRYEMHDLESAMYHSDPHAFVSITSAVKILGHFYEQPHD
ncbi:hypothetical protein IV38_GL000416 [Lactobacillus selangorensis]|uniref:DUF2179 domain-containing protein n=2 Tax=Lactobacillus selangorensis TaxID=81857 RepID=A0A0R2FPD8_9LACO|nr:hypothetical protein IV38_GL000416 [Lactobacillus selangorensis]KRN33939.1 hypothetical protein IV40_GL000252 [Lactobacillus selangorensis]